MWPVYEDLEWPPNGPAHLLVLASKLVLLKENVSDDHGLTIERKFSLNNQQLVVSTRRGREARVGRLDPFVLKIVYIALLE